MEFHYYRAMQVLQSILLLLIIFNIVLQGTSAAYDDGWQPAHATFYGGSDAAGTMGKRNNLTFGIKKTATSSEH